MKNTLYWLSSRAGCDPAWWPGEWDYLSGYQEKEREINFPGRTALHFFSRKQAVSQPKKHIHEGVPLHSFVWTTANSDSVLRALSAAFHACWWFGPCFFPHIYWAEEQSQLHFSDGLKPPTCPYHEGLLASDLVHDQNLLSSSVIKNLNCVREHQTTNNGKKVRSPQIHTPELGLLTVQNSKTKLCRLAPIDVVQAKFWSWSWVSVMACHCPWNSNNRLRRLLTHCE